MRRSISRVRWRWVALALVAGAGTLLSGCATLLAGTEHDVEVRSKPPKARVLVDGTEVATTPATIRIDKSSSHTVEIRKRGFESAFVDMQTTLGAGWVLLDVLVFGAIPLIVDAATGAWNYFDRSDISVELHLRESNFRRRDAPPERSQRGATEELRRSPDTSVWRWRFTSRSG